MGNEKKILIIDDVKSNRIFLKKLLSNLGFNYFHEASDGFEALEVICQSKPDLVLLDVLMPRMDGFLLSEILQGVDRWKNIKIIFQSGLTGEENIVKGIQVGALGYLEKPISLEDLKELVELAFDEPSPIFNQLNQDLQNIFIHLESTIKRTLNMLSGKIIRLENVCLAKDAESLQDWEVFGQIEARGDLQVSLQMGWPKSLSRHIYETFVGMTSDDEEDLKGAMQEALNLCLGNCIGKINDSHPVKLGLPVTGLNKAFDRQQNHLQQFLFEFELHGHKCAAMISVTEN